MFLIIKLCLMVSHRKCIHFNHLFYQKLFIAHTILLSLLFGSAFEHVLLFNIHTILLPLLTCFLCVFIFIQSCSYNNYLDMIATSDTAGEVMVSKNQDILGSRNLTSLKKLRFVYHYD